MNRLILSSFVSLILTFAVSKTLYAYPTEAQSGEVNSSVSYILKEYVIKPKNWSTKSNCYAATLHIRGTKITLQYNYSVVSVDGEFVVWVGKQKRFVDFGLDGKSHNPANQTMYTKALNELVGRVMCSSSQTAY